jgi:hypothetical protein
MSIITSQDIKQATERLSNTWKLVKSLEDFAASLRGELIYHGEFISNTNANVIELDNLNARLAIVEDQKAKLLAEIDTQNLTIAALQKELESRPKLDPNPVEPEPKPQLDIPVTAIPFTIKDTTGQGRSVGEYAFTGIPLAKTLGVKDVNQLRVVGDGLVTADIRPTAYWPDGSIQWVQVVFPVEGFKDSIQYELLVYENPQAPPISQIHAEKNGFSIYVKNEAKEYGVSVAGVYLEGSLSGSGIKAIFEGKESAKSVARDIYIEYLGPLVCYVVVEGVTDLSFSTYTNKEGKIKHAPISFRRRYQFLANSSLIICQESLYWEGSFNGTSHEKDQPEKPYGQRDPNAVLGTLWSEEFRLSSPISRCVILAESSEATFNTVNNISLEQKLRPQRLANDKKSAYPGTYELKDSSGLVSFGDFATGGILSVRTMDGQYVTVALKGMDLHEPQAIRLVVNGIRLDLASDRFWLPHHSGVEVTYAIHVGDKQPDLNHIWRQVNKPLRGLCQPEWYNESGGFDSVGGIMIPQDLNDSARMTDHYDNTLEYTVKNTIDKMTSFGFQGLMTWGLYPRYWAEWGFNSGELGSGVGSWDELLRNSTFTDYWCTSKLALEWALRSGEVNWIEDLTIPAAVRMLHTQIFHSAPDDSFFYAGQAPAGYAMYRSDMNSSHQYWENIYLYYLVTGDRTVIDTIERGAVTMASWLQEKKLFTGRHPMQWIHCFLFLSYCHYDSNRRAFFDSYFSSFVEQAIRNHYLEGNYNGQKEAIWIQQPKQSVVSATYESHQLFSLCFYDIEMLYHFGLKTNNEPINGIRPFDIMINIAHTIIRQGIGSESKNVETSAWLRIFNVDYDGKGNFTRLEGGTVTDIKVLYPDDKGTLLTFFSRCAWLSNDPAIKRVSRELVNLIFKQIAGRGLPFGKLIGMLMSRLSAAVVIEQMIDSSDSVKSSILHVRIPDSVKDWIIEESGRLNMNMSDFVRSRLSGELYSSSELTKKTKKEK